MRDLINCMKDSMDTGNYSHYDIEDILNTILGQYSALTPESKIAINYNLYRLVTNADYLPGCSTLIRDYFYWEMYENSPEMYNYDYIYPFIWRYCNYSDDCIIALMHKYPRVSSLYEGDNPTIRALGALLI